MSLPRRYSHIDFVPPANVAQEARNGLHLRKAFGRGGTAVGLMRARDLKNRRKLSPRTIKRMVSFFARHAVDKRGKDFGNLVRPSNGFIAWLLWGGDPGKKWCEWVRTEMQRADESART